MNELFEIYDAKIGQTLSFSYDIGVKEIASELLENNKVGTIDRGLNNWVVKITSTLHPRDWVDLIVQSEFYDREDFIVKLKPGMSITSFRIALYNRFKDLGIKRTIKIHGENQLTFKKKAEKFNVSEALDKVLIERQEFEATDGCRARSMSQLLYKEAKSRGVKIKIDTKPGYIVVTKKVEEVKKDGTIFAPSDYVLLTRWVAGLDFNKPSLPPASIVQNHPENYVRACLSNMSFDTSYRGGLVTKKQFCVRVIKGEVCLRVNSQTIHVFRDINLVSQMTEAHYKLANILLAPYGGLLSV